MAMGSNGCSVFIKLITHNLLSNITSSTLTSLFKEATSGALPEREAGADVLVKLRGPIPESGSLSEECV